MCWLSVSGRADLPENGMANFPTPPAAPPEERGREWNHMLRLEQQAEIRRLAAEKMSISAIAGQLGLDRKMIRSFLLMGPPPQRAKNLRAVVGNCPRYPDLESAWRPLLGLRRSRTANDPGRHSLAASPRPSFDVPADVLLPQDDR